MMGRPKLGQIADPIHRMVGYSNLEKGFLSTTLLNRLHNILQNSTLYFTYPAARTSRFVHSIGVLDYAGQMFRNGLINAVSADRSKYLAELQKALSTAVSREPVCKQWFDTIAEGTAITATFDEVKLGDIQELIYSRNVPAELNSREQLVFIIMFQAVRLAGLLHDLAHPPFSHVTEHALEALFDEIETKRSTFLALTLRERAFLAILKGVGKEKKGDKPLHESLGIALILQLAKRVIVQFSGQSNSRRLFVLFCLVGLHEIFVSDEIPFKAIYESMVSGALDADRLDYVSRDTETSGLGKPLNYDRLLSTYTFLYDKGSPKFGPSIRAIGELELFFRARFDLYRYAIFHHRVRKFDGLLKEVIIEIGREHLVSSLPHEDLGSETKTLPFDVSSLWKIFGTSEGTLLSASLRERYYSQWDDPFLLAILRHYYFSKFADDGPAPSDHLRSQLSELLSSEKQYTSLFKRVDAFREVDKAFLDACKAKFPSLFGRGPIGKPKTKPPLQLHLEKVLPHDIITSRKQLPSTFALTLVCRAFTDYSFIRRAAASLCKGNIAHSFVVTKPITAGLDDKFEVVTDAGLQRIDLVSNMRRELEAAARLFPPFFVFVLPGNGKVDVARARRKLGKALFWELVSIYNAQKDTI